MKKGVFISFEGTDASGKTTQIGLLKQHLEDKGYQPLMLREPGGTPIGEKIRSVILSKENGEMTHVTEALLYAAARAQLVEETIMPALEEGRIVISDRFLDSSIAYQGYGREMGGEVIKTINQPAVRGLEPDLTFFLKVDPKGMRARRSADEEDRMDAQKLDFHQRVLAGYLAIAEAEPERVKVIDGEDSIENIAAIIAGMADRLLESR